MAKILKYHASNIGTPNAWYPDFHYDVEETSPHLLIHAANGTGKSTILSTFYSLFDPRQHRWLHHVIDDRSKFSDYFRPGLPHFTAAELGLPGFRRVIIGTSVYSKPGVTPPELERWWFFIRPQPGLEFKDLPFIGIQDDCIKTRTQALEWRARMKQDFPGSFQVEESQAKWVELLNAEGVDPGLIASQIVFSETEGGVQGWLKVAGEPDLVERLLKLAVPNDEQPQGKALMDVYKDVSEAVKGLTGLPARESHHAILATLKDRIAEFAGFVTAKQQDETALEGAKDRLAQLAAEAQFLADELQAQVNDLNTLVTAKTDESAAEKRKAAEARSKGASAARMLAYAALYAAEGKLAAAIDAIAQAKADHAAAEAAAALEELTAAKATLEALREERNDIVRASGSDVEALERSGDLFHSGLQRDAAALDLKVEAAEVVLEHDRQARVSLANAQAENIGAAAAKRAEAGSLRKAAADAEKALKALEADGAIAAGESPAAAIARLDQRDGEIVVELGRLDTQIDGYRLDETIQTGLFAETRAQLGTVSSDLETKQALAERGRRERTRLLKLPSFVKRAGEDADTDPDAAVIGQMLEDEKTKLEDARTKAKDRRRQADDAIAFIRAKGHGQPRQDVLDVVAKLQDEHLWAVAAETYLSDNIADLAVAKDLIAADPARFTGVFVQGKDLGRAHQLVAGLKLTGPVVLSEPGLEATPRSGALTALPFSAAAFNKGAAAAELEAWTRISEESAAQINTWTNEIDSIAALMAGIASWTREFGAGRLAAIETSTGDLTRAKSDLDAKVATIRRSIEEIRARIAELTKVLAALRTEEQRNHRWTARIGSWIATHAPALDGIAKADSLETEAADLQRQIENAKNALAQVDANIAEGTRIIADSRRVAAELRSEAGQVSHRANLATDTDLPVETLRSAYESRLAGYMSSAGERIQILEVRIENAAEKAGKADAVFTRKSAGVDPAAIEAAKAAGIEASLAAATRNAALAERDKAAANQETGRAKGELDSAKREELRVGAHPDADLWTMDEAVAIAAESPAEAATADRASRDAEAAVGRAQVSLAQKQADARLVDTALARARKLLEVSAIEPTASSLAPKDLHKAIDSAEDDVKRLDKAAIKSANLAKNRWEDVRNVARRDDFKAAEPALSAELEKTAPDAAMSMADQHIRLTEDRIASVASDLAQADKHRLICLQQMISIADQMANLLETGVRSARIPETSKYFPGMAIMKMSWKQDRLSPKDKEDRLGKLLDAWIRGKVVPDNAWLFATHCLLHCAKWDGDRRSEPLGIELLRPKPERPEHKCISEVKFSGGEGLTAAILVYLIVAQIRSRTATGLRRTGDIGVLILDNPIGAANRRDLIEMQLYMADVTGLQLIYATGINEEEAISPFPNLLRMAPTAMRTIDGVEHVQVKVASWKIKHGAEPA